MTKYASTIHVKCDVCGMENTVERKFDVDCLQVIRAQGWAVLHEGGKSQDLCPLCDQKRKNDAEMERCRLTGRAPW